MKTNIPIFFILLLATTITLKAQTGVEQFSVSKLAETPADAPIAHVIDLDFSFNKTDRKKVKMYVADELSPHVIVLEQKEDQLRMKGQIGERGRGPGEFHKVSNLQVMGEEELFAYDSRLKRASVFNIESQKVARMFNLDGNRGYNTTRLFAISDNTFFAREERFFRESDKLGEKRYLLLKKYDKSGTMIQDSVLVKYDDDALVYRTSGGMSVNTMPVIGRKSIFRFDDNKIYHAWTGENKINVYDYSGQKLNSIEPAGIKQKRVTESDFENFLKIESKLEGTRKAKLKPTIEDYIPDKWPYFDDFLIDDRGRFWIAGSVHMEEERRPWYIVSSTSKELIGKVHLPANFTAFQIKGGYIAGEYMDDDFKASVQLYRLAE